MCRYHRDHLFERSGLPPLFQNGADSLKYPVDFPKLKCDFDSRFLKNGPAGTAAHSAGTPEALPRGRPALQQFLYQLGHKKAGFSVTVFAEGVFHG